MHQLSTGARTKTPLNNAVRAQKHLSTPLNTTQHTRAQVQLPQVYAQVAQCNRADGVVKEKGKEEIS